MKHSILSLFIFFVIYAGNCQENANDLLNEIALSQDYIDYEDIKQDIIWSYVNDSFESEKIFQIITKTQDLRFSVCDMSPNNFPEIRGIDLFVSIYCQYAQLKSELDTKYDQIKSMPKSTVIRLVQQYYDEYNAISAEVKESAEMKSSYLQKVAASEEYRNYKIAVENIMESSFNRLYDIEGVYEYFHTSENAHLSPCNIAEEDYPDVKGFDQYVIVACYAKSMSEKLNIIYGYTYFDSQDKEYVQDHFNFQVDPNADYKFDQVKWLQLHLKDYSPD